MEPDEDMWVDGNGVLTERRRLGGQDVIVHYDDLPDKDRTVVDGIPVTTALRTVLDLAVELSDRELERMIDDCLRRHLFTIEEGLARAAEPDMLIRSGAQRVRRLLAHWM
jgi:hypothetical protein